MMETTPVTEIEHRQPDGPKNGDVCPALILAARVMCDALEHRYQPSRRQIRECCTKGYHARCSLRAPAHGDGAESEKRQPQQPQPVKAGLLTES
jgi:hypothetical protein